MHDESAAASRYEETIIIDAQNINKEFTQEQVYDELLKSGEYKSIRIDDDQIEIIVDQKYSDYWNGVIERYLN